MFVLFYVLFHSVIHDQIKLLVMAYDAPILGKEGINYRMFNPFVAQFCIPVDQT